MPNPPLTSFRPSLHGCRFSNNATVGLAVTLGRLPVGRIIGGLCGGMVLDSLRRWRCGEPPATPSSADMTRVFGAQLRSFQVPTAPYHYLRLQTPGAAPARRTASLMALQHTVAELTAGNPVPLALVCRLSWNPFALTAHHIVLAYDIVHAAASSTELAIYDPNAAGDDSVRLIIGESGIRHSGRSDVRAAFTLTAR